MTDARQTADRFILFTVAETMYAVHSRDVRHMEMIEQVTRVPNAPPFVDGVVFSRGLVVPVVNLRARFGFERAPYTLRTRLIVVQTAGGRVVGLIADEAREFVPIPPGAIQPAEDTLAGPSARYLEGIASIGDRMILVVRLERVLDFEEPIAGDAPAVGDAATA